MMGDLFNVDLDLNFDLSVDPPSYEDPITGTNFDFLPDDLFNFIDDDLKEITENGAIPNIENLINFDEDDQFIDDDIQWDFELDNIDFLENVQEPEKHQANRLSVENEQICSNKSLASSSNKSTVKKSKQKSNKQNDKYDQTISSTSYSSPNSPQSTCYSTENNSNDSTDFLDMFQNYYSLDSDNNLISHPIANLSIDELNKLSNSYNQQSTHTFDLSNNFGGFVDMQSAFNLVNGVTSNPKLVSNKKLNKRSTKSKGISLLANKPKSYKTIKKEMQLKKNNSSISKFSKVQQQCSKQSSIKQQITHSTTQITIISTFSQDPIRDHDYCSTSISN